jgi:molecular chaperone HscA
MMARQLREQQVEALRLIESVEAAMQVDSNLLNADEILLINKELGSLRELAKSDQLREIEKGIETLGEATADFAAKRMDEGIRKALTGRTIEGVSETFGK